ncbi:MAG: FG-GAP-like repeat-containing protein, partial [Armatimonadota bacterium]
PDEPEPNLPLERCFDKLSFRASFDPEDEYLLIDGIGMGSHGHFDTNGITEMTAHDRVWLVDMSYAEGPNMRDHNTVTVLRDGMGGAAPPLAALDAAADLSSFGLTQTSVPAYNGLDWCRHVLWRKGEYFFVVDELQALADGQYNTRCYWRTLGEPELDGPDLRVTQQVRGGNETVRVAAVDGASGGRAVEYLTGAGVIRWPVALTAGQWTLRLVARGSHPGNDSLYVDLDGQRAGELHLSQTGLAPASLTLTVAHAGEHEIALTLREGPGTVVDRLELSGPGDAVLAVEAEDAELGAPQANRIDALTIACSGVQSLSMVRDRDNFGKWWADYRYADPAVNILQQQTTGPMRAGQVRSIANLLTVSGTHRQRAYALERYEGAWAIRGAAGDVTLFALRPGATLPGLDTDAAAVALSPDRIVARDVTRLDFGPLRLRAEAPISVELDPVTGAGLAVVGQGPVRLTLGGAARELPPGRSEFAGAPFGALDDELRATLGALRPLQRLEPRETPFAGAQGGMSVRWEAELGSPALSVAVGDLEGDGRRSVVVGCEDSRVRLLDDAGALLWEFAAGGKINSVCTADVDGDGKREIIAGSDDRRCYCLNRDGSERWSYEGAATDNPYWRRYWKAGEVEKVIAADIDGDGRDEVIFGAANMHLHALDHDGSLLWRFTKYGVITSLLAWDMTGDGRMEVIGGPAKITCTSEVSVLDAEGARLGSQGNDGWASALTALTIADLDGEGAPAVICGTNFNNVIAHDSDAGRLTQRWRTALGDVVTALCGVDFAGGGRQVVVAGSASEYAYCLTADGSIRWATPLGGPLLRLLPVPRRDGVGEQVIAITDRAAIRLDADGRGVAWLSEIDGVTDAVWAEGLYLVTQSGRVLALDG